MSETRRKFIIEVIKSPTDGRSRTAAVIVNPACQSVLHVSETLLPSSIAPPQVRVGRPAAIKKAAADTVIHPATSTPACHADLRQSNWSRRMVPRHTAKQNRNDRMRGKR